MFSVIIPAYNCEKTIHEVLESVLRQTRLDLVEEIIIVNDGSTDKTQEIIEKYIVEHDQIRFLLLNQKNMGSSFSRNRGILQAKGEWIALLDSDDIWLETKIERQAEEIQHNPNILFLGTAFPLKVYHKSYYRGLYKLSAKQLCFRNVPSTPSVVFKKSIGIELGLFNEKMKFCEDINFFQRFLTKDSYFVLAENLVKININKSYHGQSGLSSHFIAMNKGRNLNVIELNKMGLISKTFMFLMLICNCIKLFRRIVIYIFDSILSINKECKFDR